MDFPIDVAVEEVVAAVKSEGLAYEDDDSVPYASVHSVSNTASAIEFSLDTNLIEASGILLVVHDGSLGLVEVYVVDFDSGSFRVVNGERIELTAHTFALDLADSLVQSPRAAYVRAGSEWEGMLSFELAR
jgi:hypothetical protein|nr:MAG TPA: hypothetical protein [Caudoviricetes sp.]